jgi:hypothetical protein
LEFLFSLLFLGENELPIAAFVLEHPKLGSEFIVLGITVFPGLDDGEMECVVLLRETLILFLERLEKQLVLGREHLGIIELFLELLEPFCGLDEIVEQAFDECHGIDSQRLAVV